ncbi:MAG TPA: hypothetical protein VFF84_11050 [Sphingobium sp.]|nr:hypothetical protein [Sphingobium sp.]
MRSPLTIAAMMGCLIAIMPVAATASEVGERNAAIGPLLDCREEKGDAARLACFDRESAILATAAARNEIAVLDKQAVRETRRSLFGFSLPRLPFLSGGRDNDGDEDRDEGLQAIEATIKSARSLGYGKWQIELDSGARWATTETIAGRSPEAGKAIEIRRGAIGSYFGKIDGGRAVRMKRVE